MLEEMFKSDGGLANRTTCVRSRLPNNSKQVQLIEAIAYLQKAIKYNSKSAQSHLILGRLYCLLGEPRSAVDAYLMYTELRPDNPLGHLELAFAYEANNNIADAIVEWKTGGVTSSELIDAGEQDREAKRLEEALLWYGRAMLVGENSDAWFYTGITQQELKKWQKALDAYSKALELNTFSQVAESDIYLQQGIIYQGAEGYIDFNKALQMYNQALDLDDFSSDKLRAEVFYRRGYLYEQQGRDPKESIREYQRALFIRPNHNWARLRLGYAWYWAYKDVKGAESNIQEALDLWPNDGYRIWPYKYLGDIYLDAGLLDNAIAAYKEVLKIDPDNNEVKEILAELNN
jgi:tetratricopeptide (TPR) repeat protein